MTQHPGRTVYVPSGDGWAVADEVPPSGPAWVRLSAPEALRDEARARGVSAQALRMLDQHVRVTDANDGRGMHLRGRVNRSNDGELLLSMPTVSYVESTRDVTTSALTCVVAGDVILACERGDGGVLDRAAEKLCDGLPVPDRGVRQVLAAIVLTLVNRAGEVEAALGDAVAQAEQVVFSEGDPGADPLGLIYGLKREIAEARRALGPMTSALPELEAEAQAAPGPGLLRRRGSGDASTDTWLRRVRERSDRIDAHLDSHDDLLDAMLTVHLSRVSVRQNEDMRKISAWAAMITVPTMIAGIYGMNFRHMPELDWVLGYPMALVLMAAACAALFRAFRRSGWL
ncbi:magnesium and cobalt transport protein CorA [Cellulomonas gilvus]|uniref:magnesium and cobalt transport protein CorA n=1 Tax=Cellulomonas gilvus TaxID=11 RepID=UPI0002EA0FA4|nr:magnesium and cobalt transport protein CorA [Cellulomonas gilvus]